MRTIKASEVRKGMRVRYEAPKDGATLTTEGIVTRVVEGGSTAILWFGEHVDTMHPDRPVTVLAEPEPEWVEGAWYRCRVGTNEPENLRRLPHGWSPFHDTDRVFHLDDDPDITVLGRVLIVDWPGDDVARAIERTYTPGGNWIATENTAAQIIADAIRTQGGVR